VAVVPPRNVVVFLCDQLRPDFLPLYGCDALETPNIDRIAEMGVTFENAITQSTVCGPARASMMTGRYVSDHGVWTNDVSFRDGLEYLPERMNEAGYTTGVFGQLHHHPARDLKGFQEAAQYEEGRLGDDEPYRQWLAERHPELDDPLDVDAPRFEFPYPEEEYYEHWIASNAIDFVDRHDDPDDTFLAWVSFQGPHGPLDPPAEVRGSVDTQGLPDPLERPAEELEQVVRYRQARDGLDAEYEEVMERRTAYAELIVEIDRQIGRVLDALEDRGILSETTLVFSADHGDLLGDFGLNAKGPFPYRGQLDVPMVVANHPDVPEGERTESLAGTIDLPGTCLDVAGDDAGLGVSRSLIDLAGPDPEQPREVVFSEFCDAIKTVDDGRYRLSYYPFTGRTELYDRDADPDELENLAGDPAVADVEQELLMHLIDFGIVAKGPRVESKDFVPDQQAGLRRKHPRFERDFPVVFPLSDDDVERLEEAGLSTAYNEFATGEEIVSAYDEPYWVTDEE
jgi:arylsulfatase A-like enzyme